MASDRADSSDGTVHGPLVPLVEDLATTISAGLTWGFQLFVSHGHEVLADVAAGWRLGRSPLRVDTLHNLYCGAKPVVALAAAWEFEQCGVDVATVSVTDATRGAAAGPATIADLLCHGAGLGSPRAAEYFLGTAGGCGPDDLGRIPARVVTSKAAEYSEVMAWTILGDYASSLRANTVVTLVDRWSSGTAGADIALHVGPLETSRIGFYVDMAAPQPVPLLHDRLSRFTTSGAPGVMTGYASMAGLGRWYDDVLRCIEGRSVPGLPSGGTCREWVRPQRRVTHDRVLGRPCSFGFGFMTGLKDHGFGGCPSPSAFGHVGFMGNSFGLADPEAGLAVAFLANGIPADRRANIDYRRHEIVSSVYERLGLA